MKHIEPQIHKLYAELVGSEEPLDKRLQLLFLASDFFIHSKLKQGASHLIHVLQKRKRHGLWRSCSMNKSWRYTGLI
ncbi:hypothetical protein LR68_01739 [Anoxybacillus sp. BCO1]|nr:hypothetical protein LR68_01739 [Anoxybacillus sp. BCO1]